MPFPLPKGKPEFSKLEESILQYWKADKTFEKSVESRPADNIYRFYDGPPFITGTPHYGNLLSSIIKDVIPRYQTMLGKRVERVWGWDCHGLPIEQKVQKKLGLESNKEIEESEGGIQKFIDECYAYTRETSSEWGWYIDHIGRWVDMDNAYRTMDQNYMESVMWVFKQIWEKGYVYEGKRVSWYSWKLSTPISNFEIAMDDSYQDVQDPAITVKFPIKEVKPGVAIIIQDEAGKILMIKNKKDGFWRFGGGNVEKGEDRHTAAARELLEETGITCALEPYSTVYEEYRGNIFEAQVFRGIVPVGQKVILEEDNFTEHEFFSLDALPVRSEIHPMEYALLDFLTGVREPILLPETSVRSVSFLAWTTTPWTIPMHMALAVNNDITYAQVLHDDGVYILAQSRVEAVFKGKGDYQIIGTMRGEELEGLHYQPPFDFYTDKIDDKNFTVYHADFVTDTDGTGIAHEAPEFGDVDFQLAKEKGIHITSAIDEAGKYTAEIPDYAGTLYFEAIEPICERLKTEGTLFKKESITHRVPYCPRSNTPLIQKAQKSWFIDIQRIKKELIEQNESINWFPDHFKHGRFLKSLESAPDWCISRSRFWGTPMPVWQNSDGSERVVIDSREELYQKNKPLGQITKVIFVRHGETQGNVDSFFAFPDTPLTKKGQEQAKKLVPLLKKEHIDVIISSPFDRTMQTAAPIAEELGMEILTDVRLQEWSVGGYAGKPYLAPEIIADTKKAFSDPTHKRGGGECLNDMMARAQSFLEAVQKNFPGKTVLLVSHNAFGRVFFANLRDPSYLHKQMGNTEIRTFYIDHNTGKEINLHRPYIDRIYVPGKFSFTPKKVLGVHGYNRTGEVVDFFEETKKTLEKIGIEMVNPIFERGVEKVTYANWEKILDDTETGKYDTWVTHSLGSRVAREYIIDRNIELDRLIMVAPRYGLSERPSLAEFEAEMKHEYSELKKHVREIIIVSSEDDPVVPYSSSKQVAEATGGHFVTVNGMGHFNVTQSTLLENIIQNGVPLRRIPEVLDVWMDSASMPYAQVHYPFENEAKMEASFPADFIAEYTGQIRAWFYVMHVLGVLVKGSPAFKNVAVTGVINGTDGRKMSKSFGNYPDPRETIEKYGADAIRFYLMSGPIMRGEDMNFSETGIAESIKRVLLPLWNAYTFFATYANIDGWELEKEQRAKSKEQKGGNYNTPKTHELDTWIISRLHTLIQDVRGYMDIYDLQKASDAIITFLDGLNNWYIRRNRRRFWRSELDADKKSAYETLHEVLITMTKLLAPICPFITEHLYQNLMGGEQRAKSKEQKEGLIKNSDNAPLIKGEKKGDFDSVHLTDFPEANKKLINKDVNQKMTDLQNLTNLGLAIRGREKLRVRQPLRAATITLDLDDSAREILAEELNVKEVHTTKDVSEYVTITYSPDAKKIGTTERKQWMKTIIADAKAGKGILKPDGTLEVTVPEAPNEKVILAADEFEAVYVPKEGSTIAFAGNAGYVIGLDTALDEELTIEGYSRDLIRGIQDARKELGFEVTDRLQLSLSSENPTLAQILQIHQGMIEKETLTTLDSTSRPARPSSEYPKLDLAGMTNSKEVEIDEGFIVILSLTH